MVGDGATDLEARPPADLMIGFGGVVVREKVRDHADWFVTDFKELADAL
jgi:phosphoserine phosphatase